jgi:hypothetical protein
MLIAITDIHRTAPFHRCQDGAFLLLGAQGVLIFEFPPLLFYDLM